MIYIWSDSVNPHFNLALEQYAFDNLSKDDDVFMLWQNDNSIIVGIHQNTIAEINSSFVKEHNINVVRRLSGGGAVYHDLGNVNFTFISQSTGRVFDFSSFVEPIIKALATLGVEAACSGRNDVTIDGKKISGNAQYQKNNKVMHHGTILFDSDMSVLSGALNVSSDKLKSSGVKSVSSRVTNIRPLLKKDIDVATFIDVLYKSIDEQIGLETYTLTEEDLRQVDILKEQRYDTWDWNYGQSPPYTLKVEKRFDMVGKIEILLDIKESRIDNISFYGDYFGDDTSSLEEILKGKKLEQSEIIKALDNIAIEKYFSGLKKDDFEDLLLSTI